MAWAWAPAGRGRADTRRASSPCGWGWTRAQDPRSRCGRHTHTEAAQGGPPCRAASRSKGGTGRPGGVAGAPLWGRPGRPQRERGGRLCFSGRCHPSGRRLHGHTQCPGVGWCWGQSTGRTGSPGVCLPVPALGREAWPCPPLSGPSSNHPVALILHCFDLGLLLNARPGGLGLWEASLPATS